MRILFDIGHPAHVHFFKHAIALLQQQNHDVLVTSRYKEMATDLLDRLGIEHTPLSRLVKGGLFTLGKELIQRDFGLYKYVRRHKPDMMTAIGGVSIAHVGRLKNIPSLVFYDTENAKLQNAITYPFASCVLVPQCYQSWTPKHRTVRYPGYHELAYLHPNYFTPDRTIAQANGLDPQRDTFFLRLVSWQANHDVGEEGWSPQFCEALVNRLSQAGKVIISSETPLPESLQAFAYQGDLSQVHHLMAFCRLFIGESATMASECAVLGVPALYVAHTGRGYTDEQESKYQLVTNIKTFNPEAIQKAIDQCLSHPADYYRGQGQRLLDNCIDVTQYIVDSLLHYPAVLNTYQKQIAS